MGGIGGCGHDLGRAYDVGGWVSVSSVRRDKLVKG